MRDNDSQECCIELNHDIVVFYTGFYGLQYYVERNVIGDMRDHIIHMPNRDFVRLFMAFLKENDCFTAYINHKMAFNCQKGPTNPCECTESIVMGRYFRKSHPIEHLLRFIYSQHVGKQNQNIQLAK